MMRAGISAAIVAASMLAASAASADCVTGRSRDCVNLNLAPQVTQDIVAAEPITTPAKRPPVLDAASPYTGPTIGINRSVRQAPEIGYRWAIN
jgi:hypothetical protein